MSSQAIRKPIAVVIAVALLITAFSFTAFAENINVNNFEYKAINYTSSGETDVTSSITVRSGNSLGRSGTLFSFPVDGETLGKLLILSRADNLKVGDQYNCKFSVNTSYNSQTIVQVTLDYMQGNTLKSQQVLYEDYSLHSGWNDFDFDFVPEKVTSGYKCYLQIAVYCPRHEFSTFNVYFSDSVQLVNQDDNSGFIDGIWGTIKHIFIAIVGGECSDGDYLSVGLFGKLQDGFSDLSTKLHDTWVIIAGGVDSNGDIYPSIWDNIRQSFKQYFDDISTSFSDTWVTIVGGTDSSGNTYHSLWYNIKESFREFFNNVGQWFRDLGEDISNFFTSLKNWLLYFKNPVTINSDGTPVDGNGNPVYTNPFDSAFGTVKDKLDEWITQLKSFCDNLSFNSMNVSSYLNTFTNAYNRFFGSNSGKLIGLVVSLAFVLIVIKKVVGR